MDMSTYSTIRTAVSAEIKKLTTELAKLNKMLAELGDTAPALSNDRSSTHSGKRKYTRRQQPNENDIASAVKIIQGAGKGGIKAIKLAYEMKKQGGNKIGKEALLATEKVKMTGKGGGSTYTYAG